jgi:hypothetical protein
VLALGGGIDGLHDDGDSIHPSRSRNGTLSAA